MTNHTVGAHKMQELFRRIEMLENQQVGRELFNLSLTRVADAVDSLNASVKDWKEEVNQDLIDLREQNKTIRNTLIGIAFLNLGVGGISAIIITVLG